MFAKLIGIFRASVASWLSRISKRLIKPRDNYLAGVDEMTKPAVGVVYWLSDERCICLWRHGYVGVTVSWPHRLHRHRCETQSDFLPDKFNGQVIFRGPIKQCLEIETQLRPKAGIGWNRLPGGLSGHAMKGVPKSPEQREKMRQAALRRWANTDEAAREKHSKIVSKGLKHIDRTGANNPSFGKHQSEETKQKVRERIAERGGISGANNPNFRHGGYVGE
jgi:hypothetical protein